ncbi:hypothetical protein [Frateuria sp. Soil773]|uniref:hypothetical protein n=1 Tax=Frateuria sp. Soil773 TaxID=1736407 RepID=UPI0012F932B9|nr:hypothetical protein [Frateuria sp. Soil773]
MKTFKKGKMALFAMMVVTALSGSAIAASRCAVCDQVHRDCLAQAYDHQDVLRCDNDWKECRRSGCTLP